MSLPTDDVKLDPWDSSEANELEPRHYNRPGLTALNYRLGTHATFLRRMLKRLPAQVIPDGPNHQGTRPLAKLTTRASDDPAIALLDAWATAADVLTFYQERIANEGYLSTATERRSVLELARAIGYELNPGVAASAFLGFTVEDAPGAPGVATVPQGTQVMSIPGQDELPQIFETTEAIEARAEWNALKPHQPQKTVSQEISRGTKELYLKGIKAQLQPGDAILMVGEEREKKYIGSERWDFRTLQTVTPNPKAGHTHLTWEAGLGHEKPTVEPADNPRVFAFRRRAALFGHNAPEWRSLGDEVKAEYVPNVPNAVNSVAFSPDGRRVLSGDAGQTLKLWDVERGREIRSFSGHADSVNSVAFSPDGRQALSGSADKTLKLWGVHTGNEIRTFTGHTGSVNSVAFSPDGKWALSGSADGALKLWDANTGNEIRTFTGHQGSVNSVAFSPDGKWALSGSADGALKLWDANTGNEIRTFTGHQISVNSVAFSPDGERILSGSADGGLKLWNVDTGNAIRTFAGHQVSVNSVAFSPDGRQALSGSADKTLKLWDVHTGNEIRTLTGHLLNVYSVEFSPDGLFILSGSPDKTIKLWEVKTGRELHSFAGPTTRDHFSEWPGFEIEAEHQRIDLDALYPKILAGSWIALMKPGYVELYKAINVSVVWRTDFKLSSKVTRIELDTREHLSWFGLRNTVVFAQSEPLELALIPIQENLPVQGDEIELDRLVQGLNPGQTLIVSGKRVGAAAEEDKTLREVALIKGVSHTQERTTITLREPLRSSYDRTTVVINANVARATHGETVREEVLGSGDGTQANQRFGLRKPPLTYISAPTPRGGVSALEVRVNGVLWQEAPSLYGLDARSQHYIVRIDDNGETAVIFGDGESGARTPSGQENVVATYRSGIGPDGEVDADSLRLLQTRPLGIREVTNPTPATGAAAPETRDEARAKVPLTVLTLERIVSLRDFENFARAFAGIGKAQAVALWYGETRLVHLTVAAATGNEVLPNSGLYINLVRAIDAVREPVQPVRVESYELLLFNLEAKVLVHPRYTVSSVLADVKTTLQSTFVFERRNFGQSVTSAEVITALQSVAGVVAVDLDYLYLYFPDSSQTLESVPDSSQTLESVLPAKTGRVEEDKIKPGQLLLLNPDGIKLEEMKP